MFISHCRRQPRGRGQPAVPRPAGRAHL